MTNRTARRLAVLLAGGAVLLLAWTTVLALTLDDHRSHWVVLDLLEALALLAVSRTLWRDTRHRAGWFALGATPLFLYDALQDVVTSHRSAPSFVAALAMAAAVEVPAVCLLLWTARTCLHEPRRG